MSNIRRKELLKVVVLGDSGVGKTCLLNQYVHQKFSQSHKATVGADFSSKEISIDEKLITLQVWDTAGQERFVSLGKAFYRGANACVLVCDYTNRDSLTNLQKWHNDFIEQLPANENPQSFPFIVMANKSDIVKNRQLRAEDIRNYCVSHNNMPFFETSAKDGLNVEQAFECVAKLALSRQPTDNRYQLPLNFVPVDSPPPPASKSCC